MATKGPLTAYLFFFQENRSKLVAENPGVHFNVISKELGRRWKALTDVERVPYVLKSEEDKKRYERLHGKPIEANLEEVEGLVFPPPGLLSNLHETNATKHPLSAWVFFLQENRPKVVAAHPDWDHHAISKELGKQWKALSDEERTPYIKKGEVDRKRYEDEKRKYQEKEIEDTRERAKATPHHYYYHNPNHHLPAHKHSHAQNHKRPRSDSEDDDGEEKEEDEEEEDEDEDEDEDEEEEEEEEEEEVDEHAHDSETKFQLPGYNPNLKNRRALSPYMFFFHDHRNKMAEEHKNWTFADVGKEMGKRWKDLPAEEKHQYIKKSKQDKEKKRKERARDVELLPKRTICRNCCCSLCSVGRFSIAGISTGCSHLEVEACTSIKRRRY